ncbi:hypothetical protein MNB_SV-13-1126 [hydrothermal vent metagenome]|uniref:Uncharacterized protein n=1 Tax=hydrothermal vent metagenome TaxID=652676 RepID=A0A1W1CLE8_9ZZZZ
MKRTNKPTLILWTKRLLAVLAIFVWIVIIYEISNSPLPFNEQAPYCMMSTMMIFGILSLAYKGLEYWERQENA